ncbi:trk system potassium uptake protein TrkH [Cohnella thailandensis]|uniref:Trk family potassium uptake protein n=1 Tax=Cohnella thailandensis TaxID=557557 RepID=A0A841SR85_9BACL|nr:TrkH family potassium uptake protein [Cohnella thailandensis]MBB6632668.1 Trk family potassium uptake protein [Cohnella thailandensis]MBP1975643.1 trk system potassium uptake protein TrkH [Cohnella thailandensis]
MISKGFKWVFRSPPRLLLIGFACIILAGTILLKLPAATAAEETTSWIDALFTATSATCVTGLVTLDTGTHWTTFGQIVILALIQIGGLGFMTMATLFAFFLKRKISLKERLILQEALNQSSMEGIVRLVRRVIVYALSIQLIGALLLSVRFLFDMSPGRAIYFGIFHAISFFNNAGFDIMGHYKSLTDYVGDPLVNIVTMLLIILGGLGFIVLSDLIDWKRTRRLTLHSKVVLSMTGFLIGFGALVILVFEYTNAGTMEPLSFGEKLLSAFLQSVSPRTAGVNSLDLASLRQATQFFLVLLMFIGASPGSTGGGIKTTTFATLIGAVYAMMRGKDDVVMFRYRLAQERVYKALTVTLLSLALVLVATMILSTTEDHHFLEILFEVTSAFSTVGLSMGLTLELTLVGKIIIIVMMFIGRVGPLSMGYAFGPKPGRTLYRYAEGKIIIG